MNLRFTLFKNLFIFELIASLKIPAAGHEAVKRTISEIDWEIVVKLYAFNLLVDINMLKVNCEIEYYNIEFLL